MADMAYCWSLIFLFIVPALFILAEAGVTKQSTPTNMKYFDLSVKSNIDRSNYEGTPEEPLLQESHQSFGQFFQKVRSENNTKNNIHSIHEDNPTNITKESLLNARRDSASKLNKSTLFFVEDNLEKSAVEGPALRQQKPFSQNYYQNPEEPGIKTKLGGETKPKSLEPVNRLKRSPNVKKSLDSEASLPTGMILTSSLTLTSPGKIIDIGSVRGAQTLAQTYPTKQLIFEKETEMNRLRKPIDLHDSKTQALLKRVNSMHDKNAWRILNYMKSFISQLGLQRIQRQSARSRVSALPTGGTKVSHVRLLNITRGPDMIHRKGVFPWAGLGRHVYKKISKAMSGVLTADGPSSTKKHRQSHHGKTQQIQKPINYLTSGNDFFAESGKVKKQHFLENRQTIKRVHAGHILLGSSKFQNQSKEFAYVISREDTGEVGLKANSQYYKQYTFPRLLDSLLSYKLQKQTTGKKVQGKFECQVLQAIRRFLRCLKKLSLKIPEEYWRTILHFQTLKRIPLFLPNAKRIQFLLNGKKQPTNGVDGKSALPLVTEQQRIKRDILILTNKGRLPPSTTYTLANKSDETPKDEVNGTVPLGSQNISKDMLLSHILTSPNSDSLAQTEENRNHLKYKVLKKDSFDLIQAIKNGSKEHNVPKVGAIKIITSPAAGVDPAPPGVNKTVIRLEKSQVCSPNIGAFTALACRSLEILRNVTSLFESVKNILKRPTLQMKRFLSSLYSKAQQMYRRLRQSFVFPSLQALAQNLFMPTLNELSPHIAAKSERTTKEGNSQRSSMLTHRIVEPTITVKRNTTDFVQLTDQKQVLSVEALQLDNHSSGSHQDDLGRDKHNNAKNESNNEWKHARMREKIRQNLGDDTQQLKEELRSGSDNYVHGQLNFKRKSLEDKHAEKDNSKAIESPKNNYKFQPTSSRPAEHDADMFSEKATLKKSYHSMSNNRVKKLVLKRSPQRVAKSRTDQVLRRLSQNVPQTEANAMAEKFIGLMTWIRNHSKPNSSQLNAKQQSLTGQEQEKIPNKSEFDYDFSAIDQDELQDYGNIDLDFVVDRKPTEADRKLLKNIESLTFLVLGHRSKLDSVDEATTPEPDYKEDVDSENNNVQKGGLKSVSREDNSKEILSRYMYKDAARTTHTVHLANMPQKKNGSTETISNSRKKNIEKLTHKYKNIFSKQRHNLGNRHRGNKDKDVLRRPQGHKLRDLHEKKARLKRESSVSDDGYSNERNEIIFDTNYRIKPQKLRIPAKAKERLVGKVANAGAKTRTKRSLNTIDLMDDFRIHWPSLRTKATTLRETIIRLKNSYNSAVDELNRLQKMGEDYNEDAKDMAARDREATRILKSETKKMKTAEAKFRTFQREIADEEDKALNYMKDITRPARPVAEKAGKGAEETPPYTSFQVQQDEASTIPENNVGVELPDATLDAGGPVMRIPLSENEMQDFPQEQNQLAGLKSTLQELEADKSKVKDENLLMIEGDLSEIGSRTDMNMQTSERRKRSKQIEGHKALDITKCASYICKESLQKSKSNGEIRYVDIANMKVRNNKVSGNSLGTQTASLSWKDNKLPNGMLNSNVFENKQIEALKSKASPILYKMTRHGAWKIARPVKRRHQQRRESAKPRILVRPRRRVVSFTDASQSAEPEDVNHVVVGFHPVDFEGDAEDAEAEDKDDDDHEEEDDETDEDDNVAVAHDDDEDDSVVEGSNGDDDADDDSTDDEEEIDSPNVNLDDTDQAHQELENAAAAQFEDLEREHAIKMWDDIGTDIEMYAAPDKVTTHDFVVFTDPVEAEESEHMDNIANGKDLVNDLEAEVLTPKKDPVIEGLVAPGIRQVKKDTTDEARLMDAIPSLDTIEDISGVLKAAGRDYRQELKLRDMGVDVDKFLEPGDLDPYNELLDDDETSDVLNQKYISFFSKPFVSGPVQKELWDIVKTRQQADAAFKSLRAMESMVDESVNPAETKTALDEQIESSMDSLRRAQQKQELQGEVFAQEEQRQEADAIKELEQNSQALIDQRMRQAHELEEDLKAAAADQVEIAARRSKLLQDLDKQTG